MRPLIVAKQDYKIVCDNCEFKIKNSTGDPSEDIIEYINKPCPICGSNLLTEKDYQKHIELLKIIAWLNKYFSWLTFFRLNKKL